MFITGNYSPREGNENLKYYFLVFLFSPLTILNIYMFIKNRKQDLNLKSNNFVISQIIILILTSLILLNKIFFN